MPKEMAKVIPVSVNGLIEKGFKNMEIDQKKVDRYFLWEKITSVLSLGLSITSIVLLMGSVILYHKALSWTFMASLLGPCYILIIANFLMILRVGNILKSMKERLDYHEIILTCLRLIGEVKVDGPVNGLSKFGNVSLN